MPLLLVVFISLLTACRDPDPNPIPAKTACETGFILDGSSCVPESCGTGRWGNLPVDDDTVYVDVTAEEGGDGTEDAPYATIQDGLNRAGALGGGLVAVAAGTYPETLAFTTEHADVHLSGRCREMVILDAGVGDEETPGISIDAGTAAVEVSGVTVSGSSYTGLLVAAGETMVRDSAISGSAFIGVLAWHPGFSGMTNLLMEGCLIEGNTVGGLLVGDPGAEVTLRDTTVRATQADGIGESGPGIGVQYGATLSAEGCLVDGNTSQGLIAFDSGTKVILRHTVVKDTLPDGNEEFGRGIEVYNGVTLFAEGCLLEGNSEVGFFASGPDTEVMLMDTTVRDTQPDANGESGFGIVIEDGSTLSVEGCLIDGNTSLGLAASSPGTEVLLRNATVRDTLPNTSGEFGRGIEVQDGATLSAEGCFIDRNTYNGLYAANPGTKVILRATVVSDTQPVANGEGGRGIEVNDGATLSAETCLIDGNTGSGLFASDPGTEVILRDTQVWDTQPDANREFGHGIQVDDGAALSAEGCLIGGNTEVGLGSSDPGTEVILWDTNVIDTHLNANGEGGRGIEVFNGATLSAKGCLIDGNAESGLGAYDPGTKVTLRNTTVKDTHANTNGEFGRGIGVQDGATLSVVGCLIDGNTDIGLFASDNSTDVNISNSTISGTKTASDLRASSASGVSIQGGALLSASHVVVSENQGPGLLAIGASSDSLLSCEACTIVGNQFAGAAAVNGGTLVVTDSTIEGTTPGANLIGGAGIYAWPWLGGPPTVVLTNTLIQDNPIAGVWLIGNGTYILDGNTISGGIGEPFGSGSRCGDAILARDGVMAWDGTSGLLLQDNEFLDASGSGVFLDDSSALMSGNTYSSNSVDLVVQNQSCDAIPSSYSEAPQRDLCPLYSYPTCYAEFFFVAMPSEPVDWEEDKTPSPLLFPMRSMTASKPMSIHPSMSAPRLRHPSSPLVFSP